MEKKKCSKCKMIKATGEFGGQRERSGGLKSWCKGCNNRYAKERGKTIEGLITTIYASQRGTSRRRNHPKPKYSNKELLKFAKESKHFIELYAFWVNSNYEKNLKPSFDRRDDSKGYSFSNFNKWMTWGDNQKKAYGDMRTGLIKNSGFLGGGHKPVIRTDRETGDETHFISISDAYRKTKIKNISACCNKTRTSAGGYFWHFLED